MGTNYSSSISYVCEKANKMFANGNKTTYITYMKTNITTNETNPTKGITVDDSTNREQTVLKYMLRIKLKIKTKTKNKTFHVAD